MSRITKREIDPNVPLVPRMKVDKKGIIIDVQSLEPAKLDLPDGMPVVVMSYDEFLKLYHRAYPHHHPTRDLQKS